MAKGKRRQTEQAKKAARKARLMKGGGKSKYAMRHKGDPAGNTRPNGMWIKVA